MKKDTKAYFDRAAKLYDLGEFARAAEEYEKALKTVDKTKEPEAFATIKNNLGTAYSNLPTGDREANLKKAIECYEKALEIWTKESSPVDYAMTQSNLGEAIMALPVGDKETNLKKAIECFINALEIRKKEDLPADYAETMNNLGTAYTELPSGDKEDNLRKAIECFKEAAEGYGAVNLRDYAEKMRERAATVERMLAELKKKKEAERKGDQKAIEIIENKIAASETMLRIRGVLESFGDTEDIFNRIEDNRKIFGEFVKRAPVLSSRETELVVLRRFNSYTPILASGAHQSRGGGYFLNIDGKGIVIDPGFSFIQNFFEAGFGPSDIDAVFVSHAHNDHTNDLESIITLLFEYNATHTGQTKKIKLYLNRTAYIKYAGWLDLQRKVLENVILLTEEQGEVEVLEGLKAKTVPAEHKDIVSEEGAVGFLFLFNGKKIFFTGDSCCSQEYIDRLKSIAPIDLLITHIGEMASNEFNFDPDKELKQDCFLGNHLGILGVIHVMQTLQPDLTLISEFGEEFKGIERINIAQKIKEGLQKPALAADINLRIRLKDNFVFCPFCNDYIKPEDITTEWQQCFPDGSNIEINALYYYCPCIKRLTPTEINRLLREVVFGALKR